MNSSGHGKCSDEIEIFPFSKESISMFRALLVLVFPACIIGNSLLIAVVHKNVTKRMRTTTNMFLVNMAISDLLAALCIPIQTTATIMLLKTQISTNATIVRITSKVIGVV